MCPARPIPFGAFVMLLSWPLILLCVFFHFLSIPESTYFDDQSIVGPLKRKKRKTFVGKVLKYSYYKIGADMIIQV